MKGSIPLRCYIPSLLDTLYKIYSDAGHLFSYHQTVFSLFYCSSKLPYLALVPLEHIDLWVDNVLPNPDAIHNMNW